MIMAHLIPDISIVVPIYNVEQYIHKIIHQILNQPFQNFELILVNDGSTDKCGMICDSYQNEDWRIRVLHKSNGGLSSARNAGINMAKGKYISFIDPDDRIHPNYFVELFKKAELNQCTAIVSSYQTIPTNEIRQPGYRVNEVMDGKTFILSSSRLHSNNDLCFVWRYLYKLQLIKEHNIKFNEKVFIGEDVIFNLEFLLKSKRVLAINNVYYYYTVNNPTSLMRSPFKPNLDKSLIIQYQIRKQLSEVYGLLKYKHFRKDMANYYINSVYRMMVINIKNNSNVDKKMALKKVMNYEMISDAIKEIGFWYRCVSVKEFIYYIALKFKLRKIIYKCENI